MRDVEGTRRAPRRTASDDAAAYILEEIFSGHLRTGDRVNLDLIPKILDCSKVPVREAAIRLQRDGILDIRFRRDVIVSPFEAATIAEHFEMYGLLAGVASARLAAAPDPEVLDRLAGLRRAINRAADGPEFFRLGSEFRREIDDARSHARLNALLRNFSSFVPETFRLLVDELSLTRLRRPINEEFRAIAAGDPVRARAATARNLAVAGEELVRVLVARGVLEAPRSAR